MTGGIMKLVEIGSHALGSTSTRSCGRDEEGPKDLIELLSVKNGFYAFESALLVRPGSSEGGVVLDVPSWNDADLWKSRYGVLHPDGLCFAEDVFGNQFMIGSRGVLRFDAETGECEPFAESLEDWAVTLLGDYEYHTGYPLAHGWQVVNGPLPPGSRLLGKRPFVLGGQYAVENLICWNDLKGMRARSALALQLRDVPDGGQVEFEYVE